MGRKKPKTRIDGVSKTGYIFEGMEARYKSREFPPERHAGQRKGPPRRPNLNRKAL